MPHAMTRKTPKKREPEEIHQVLVRMPHKTWEALDAAARESYRTINMHILWLIEEHLAERRKQAE